jgi:peptidase E/ketosteroid isomerase-like protein
MEPENGLLDKYILNLALSEKPKICFLGTASNDGLEYRKMFYDFYSKLNCEPSHLSLLEPPDDLEEFVLEKDIIHVGGGNTRMLMEKWNKSGLTEIMRKAWDKGVILTGMSAGAICWFEDGITNPAPGELQRLQCTGILDGSFCPHYDDRVELKEVYHKMISDGIIENGFGVEDGAAIHFIDNEPIRVVASRPGVTAYKVRRFRKKITEEPMESLYLGRDSDFKIKAHQVEHIESLKAVDKFIEMINAHDVEGLLELMSDDHVFIDSMGSIARGKAELETAWKAYLSLFPDYEVIIEHTSFDKNTIGLFGRAKGTFAAGNGLLNGESLLKRAFEIPASWRALVEHGKIKEWQVFADNEPVRKIIKDHDK